MNRSPRTGYKFAVLLVVSVVGVGAAVAATILAVRAFPSVNPLVGHLWVLVDPAAAASGAGWWFTRPVRPGRAKGAQR